MNFKIKFFKIQGLEKRKRITLKSVLRSKALVSRGIVGRYLLTYRDFVIKTLPLLVL